MLSITGEMRLLYPVYKEVTRNMAKLDKAQISSLKERLHIHSQSRSFNSLVRNKFGQSGRKIFLQILNELNVYERVQSKQLQKDFDLSPRYFTQQQFPPSVDSLISQLVEDTLQRLANAKKFEFPNEKLTELVEQANLWWSSIDPHSLREVHRSVFAQFLVGKGIIKKELEAERVLKSII